MTAAARLEIDSDGRGVLIARDGRWPFDLDLATGTAVLETGGHDGEMIRVRALRWQEKLVLARFAGLGQAFIARTIATACASVRPSSGPADAVLATLVAWLETPGDIEGEADPLDAGRLASMTLNLWRLTGLRPADLDVLPAGEVIQLWVAVQAEAEGLRDADWAASHPPFASPAEAHGEGEGVNRIVVIDDEPGPSAGEMTPTGSRAPSVEVDARLSAPPDGADGRTEPALGGSARRPPSVALRRGTSDPPTLVGPDMPVQPVPAALAMLSTRPGATAGQEAAPSARRSTGSATRSTGIAAEGTAPTPLIPTDAVDHESGRAQTMLTGVIGHGRAPAILSGLTPTVPSGRMSPGRARVRPGAAAAPRVVRDAGLSSPSTGATPVILALQVALGSLAPAPRPAEPWVATLSGADAHLEPGPSSLDRSQCEALFQALADELEQATAELGIANEA